MNALVVTIGDEILIGQVIDTNSAWLGQTLNDSGIYLIEILSIGDELEAIVKGIDYALSKADLVIITGGLGPTKDDITKTAIAQYFDVVMEYSEETYQRIKVIYEKFGKTMTDAHKEQCYMPANATILKNRMGTAPGMLFRKQNKILISLPGVPYEMKSIFLEEVLPIFQQNLSDIHIIHKTIMTAGEGETFIADKILPHLEDLPDYIKIAYLPSLGSVRLRLTGKHNDRSLLQNEIDKATSTIEAQLGALIYGYDDTSLEQSLMHLFKSKNLTLSAAESCTGGYFSHCITSVPGSSDYFEGAIISYSNAMKKNILKVNEETLIQHGAVSEETVKEMVKGLLDVTKTSIGVAISGIAGPAGGSEEKPVGTIWMAISNGHTTSTYKINATKDRLKNIEYATTVLMNKLRLFVNAILID